MTRSALDAVLRDPQPPAAPVWGHVTGRFRALGHDFGVRTTNPSLGRYLEVIFGGFAASGEPGTWYSLTEERAADGTWFVVDFAGERLTRTNRPGFALAMLLWHVNHETVRTSSALCLVHAAAAEQAGVAAIFPAPMESGKTTLVAGLVRAGLRYLTDEAAAIDPATLMVHPFPKALSIDPGSWEVLADLEPEVDAAITPYLRHQWQVAPEAIRPGAVARPAPVRLVVAPRYTAGADTMLEPLGRPEMLRLLAECTFGFQTQGRRNFDALAAVVRVSACYRLTVGDLGRACDLVGGLFNDMGTMKEEPHER